MVPDAERVREDGRDADDSCVIMSRRELELRDQVCVPPGFVAPKCPTEVASGAEARAVIVLGIEVDLHRRITFAVLHDAFHDVDPVHRVLHWRNDSFLVQDGTCYGLHSEIAQP